MKTIEQIAEERGVSRTIIYNRLKDYGVSLDALRCTQDKRRKLYGEEVERLIIILLNRREDESALIRTAEEKAEAAEARAAEAEKAAEKQREINEKLKATAEEMLEKERERADRAEAEKAEAKATAEKAEARVDMMHGQIDKLTDAIKAAEIVQAAQVEKLRRLPLLEAENERIPKLEEVANGSILHFIGHKIKRKKARE